MEHNTNSTALQTLGLMKDTLNSVRGQMSGYRGNDLVVVRDLLCDAAVTYAGAMTENGLPNEANQLLRQAGLSSVCDPEE